MVILNLEVWNKFCVTKMTLMFAFLALNTNNSCTALSFVTWTNKSSKTGRFKDHKFLEWPQNFAKYSSTFDYTVQQNRRRRRAAAARRITTCPPSLRKLLRPLINIYIRTPYSTRRHFFSNICSIIFMLSVRLKYAPWIS